MSDTEHVQAARLALDEATEWPRQAAVLRSRADALDVQITLEMGALSRLYADLAKEQRDVDRYEGLSVAGVIASIIGRRHERLATEVSERDALALELAVETAPWIDSEPTPGTCAARLATRLMPSNAFKRREAPTSTPCTQPATQGERRASS